VLIVEDDRVLAKQLKLFLRTHGDYNVIATGDREETLEVLEGFTPQVAVLDLGLPPFEDSPEIGLSLIPCFVKLDAKVVVLTGQSSRKAAIEAVAAGAFDYILKPASPEVLELAIKRALFIKDIEDEIRNRDGRKIAIRRDVTPGLEEIEEGNSPLMDYQFPDDFHKLKEQFERDILQKALESTGFNVVRTAKLLKISRESLYYLLRKHGIKRPE